MATSQLGGVIQHLRKTVLLRAGAGLTDGQLLEDYLSCCQEAPLAALVRRHGPMVWSVCRRVLGNHHDAEDAFQATFLVLVRKAASVVPREMLANWLYGVARQTALKARATAAKRKQRERQVAEMPERAAAEPDVGRGLQPLLDKELSRLPNRYRAVLILCDLEGKTRKQVAQQLGCPEGTVAGQLARARVMLAKRLARHGFAVSGGALAAMLTQCAASACVPSAVVCSTINAASLFAAGQAAASGLIPIKVVGLAEGMLNAMLISKLKAVVAVLLVLGFVGTGATILSCRTAAAQSVTGEERVQLSQKQKQDEGKDAFIASGKKVDAVQAEMLFRQMEGKLFNARSVECAFEGKVQPKGSFKGSLALAEANKVRVQYTIEVDGVDRQLECTVVSDGTKVVKVLNGEKPEQVFVPPTKDVPLKAQLFREVTLKSFALIGGCTFLETPLDEVKVSGFKLGKKERLAGRDTQIVEYEFSLGAVSISAEVWLDSKTTLPIKRIANFDKGAGEKYTVTEIYTSLTLNKDIDAKKFELPK